MSKWWLLCPVFWPGLVMVGIAVALYLPILILFDKKR